MVDASVNHMGDKGISVSVETQSRVKLNTKHLLAFNQISAFYKEWVLIHLSILKQLKGGRKQLMTTRSTLSMFFNN